MRMAMVKFAAASRLVRVVDSVNSLTFRVVQGEAIFDS